MVLYSIGFVSINELMVLALSLGEMRMTSRVLILRRICCLSVLGGVCLNVSGEVSYELVKDSYLWRLVSLSAQAPTTASSSFFLNQDWDVEVKVGRLRCFSSEIDKYMGCDISIENANSNVFKIVDMPSSIQAVELRGGLFDLSDLSEASNVKYFLAECVDLNVDLDKVCECFPGLEYLTLNVFRMREVDATVDSLKKLKGLRRLDICYDGPSPGDWVRKLMSELPLLEKIYVSGTCHIGEMSKGESGKGEVKRIDLSECLKTNTTGAVELPNFGERPSAEIKMSSPDVRPVEIQLPAGGEKFSALFIRSENVIPSGEMELIDNGFILYRIRIDK